MTASDRPRPVVLCILDGWGARDERTGNAVALADTPHWDRLIARDPNAFLTTHGGAVGLPDGQMGNSEVGHTNIGAGRVVLQSLPRVDDALDSGAMAENDALRALADRLRATGGVCHVMGLVSDGGVHSHMRHIAALARIVRDRDVPVVVHAFLDGRDTAPNSAGNFVVRLRDDLPDDVAIATVIGRYTAMDRDQRWERTRAAYAAIVHGRGEATNDDAVDAAVRASAENRDEFAPPTVIGDYGGLAEADGVLFANFRADRARQLVAALADPGFDAFDLAGDDGGVVRPAAVCTLTRYRDDFDAFATPLLPPPTLDDVLGAVVARAGRRQLRLAETEKYPHVTFFLNGGEEDVFEGEDRILVPSPKVATYDLQPEMSIEEVGAKLIGAVRGGTYDLIVVNFANPDMVGHTGDLVAATAACAAVDRHLGALVAALDDVGGALLVTADHGNAELMIDPETGGPHTAHTTNRVRVALHGGPAAVATLRDGALCDLAPTALKLMGIDPPAAMTGRALYD
ncbi:MAG: 2,3-bisphosphoglycerate-independent phosphoglycerate mutase [Acidobacteriota bacterium]